MAKRVHKKEINQLKHLDFVKVSKNFAEGAQVALEYDYYNAAGVLIIHAAIAMADAITIRFASSKCSGESHYDIIKLLDEVAPKNKQTANALNHFKKLIDHKNIVSYQGELYTKKDVEILQKHFERFSDWASVMLKI